MVPSSFAPRVSDGLPQRLHFALGDAVGGEFVGVKDPPRTVAFGVVGELRSEAAVGQELAADEPVEASQPDGHRPPAIGECAPDDAAVGVREDLGHVPRVADGRVPVSEFGPDIEEFGLAGHLVADDVVDVIQTLDPLDLHACALGDGDIDVLADGSEAAFDLSRRAKQHADPLGGLAGLFRAPDVGVGADLHQRDSQAVEAVAHPGVGLLDALGALLFEHHVLDADRPLGGLDGAVGRDEHRALEASGVGAVDDDLPHDVGLVDRVHVQQGGDLEGRLHGLAVDPPRGLVVLLDQAGRAVGKILKLPLDAALLEGGGVDLPQLRLGGVEIPGEATRRLLGLAQVRRTRTEQLGLGVELLVDLQAGHQPQLLVVVLAGAHYRRPHAAGAKNALSGPRLAEADRYPPGLPIQMTPVTVAASRAAASFIPLPKIV